MSPLCHLLRESRDPASVVATYWRHGSQPGHVVRWAEFRAQVAALRARIADEPAGAWLLLTDDAYAFAVGLLALWHAGRHAISPPNRQQQSLRELQTRAAGVLTDRPDWFSGGASIHPLADAQPVVDAQPVADAQPASALSLLPLDPQAPAIELFTSGTTGAEKPVIKRICHLDDELRELGAMWDAILGDATIFATAPHQHLYGLLFGVLWPLCAGRTFQAHHLLHVGELLPRMLETEHCALAGVPTHLKRLARHTELTTLRGRCRAIFSSGGPLPADTAHRLAGALRHAPLEVLGSTETGGIAWRTQEPGAGESPWTPFPSVRVTRDAEAGVARVSSPFVSFDTGSGGFATGDRIALQADGRFRLEGRADKVVKVGEKRLDLAAMESQLRGHAWVAEVALTTIGREGEPRVAAAIVPTEHGWDAIRRSGRQAFHRALRASLAEHWDPVLHPRQWRTVRRLPENAQGKVVRAGLDQLFRERDPTAADRLEVLDEIRGDDFLERESEVPTDLSCLPGHFPDRPVVPGIQQLDWAMELAADLLGEPLELEEIEQLKLIAPLGPGARFRIRVSTAARTPASSPTRIDFRLFSGRTEYARGRVRLVGDAAPERREVP